MTRRSMEKIQFVCRGAREGQRLLLTLCALNSGHHNSDWRRNMESTDFFVVKVLKHGPSLMQRSEPFVFTVLMVSIYVTSPRNRHHTARYHANGSANDVAQSGNQVTCSPDVRR